MDTSTGAAPELPRKRKIKAKVSSGPTSTGYGCLPCHRQANFTDFNAPLETPQKGADEHRSDLTINATDGTGPTKAEMVGENCEAGSGQRSKPLVEDCGVAAGKLCLYHQQCPASRGCVNCRCSRANQEVEDECEGMLRLDEHRQQKLAMPSASRARGPHCSSQDGAERWRGRTPAQPHRQCDRSAWAN
ncbi:hypothetical protein HPB50_019656 [Hyalomma asiaticum]|uniref:Uncharacterized protein n=1 Tax=Hyalomma asiaticum TaxID=266040 RepID=A0ACB7SJT0_HYAAI|nr:hypothetical protein HPB50_019656 [Hyalomma asiaticum]